MSRAYLIRIPLTDTDQLDEEALSRSPGRATVRRHWSNEPDEAGLLEPVGRDWAMRCRGKPDRLLKFDGTPVQLGQRLFIVERDGAALPFRIASVR